MPAQARQRGSQVGKFGLVHRLLSANEDNRMNTAEQTDVLVAEPVEEQVLHLPLGLLGFEPIKEYLCVSRPEEAPFLWLQAIQDPTLTFLVISPFEVISEYHPDISEEDAAFLGLNSPDEALILAIVTLRRNGRATANLKGPLVVNRISGRAKQVVLANAGDYSLQHPLPHAE
jgi:flagellar assembly factor FliW